MHKKKFRESRTYALIRDAFTAECYTSFRDSLFAKTAQEEGLSAISEEFSEFARCRNSHTLCYFNVLKDAGDEFYNFKSGNTLENIKTALQSEMLKADACVALIKAARDEGLENIAEMMEEISMDEMSHIQRLASLGEGIV
ncbi:MAG: hypothetical protein A2X86_16165 [Bdellovibrionales bacterium GWA2_49_15]|nr:MAG: hypothetical protein A2X86_16165 [Bdellovibrionales bacterium GWA2_49_15]HAZ13641.1 hypothetical protein [Bdellovibrionales bacterium]